MVSFRPEDVRSSPYWIGNLTVNTLLHHENLKRS